MLRRVMMEEMGIVTYSGGRGREERSKVETKTLLREWSEKRRDGWRARARVREEGEGDKYAMIKRNLWFYLFTEQINDSLF